MNHALDSASYGASRELYSGNDRYGCGFPVNGMELQPNWEWEQSGGRLGREDTSGFWGKLVPEKEWQLVLKKMTASGLSHRAIGRAIKFSPQGVDAISRERPYETNKTYKALKVYFGLEDT